MLNYDGEKSMKGDCMKKKVGFIGLGAMGKPMAMNLVKAGYEMHVCDINPEALKEVTAGGARALLWPREVAKASEVVITMLPDSAEIEEVYVGDNGLLAGSHEGLILIDSSTVDPQTTRRVATAATRMKVQMLDAPVGGGMANAVQGNLIMLVGGEREVLESCRDIFETVGKRIIHAGPIGAGEALKLSNNLMTGIFGCLLAEGFAFAEKVNADQGKLFELLQSNLPRILEVLAKKIIEKDFKPGFQTKLMYKDLKIISSLAQSHMASMPFGNLAKEMYLLALKKDLGTSDFTSVRTLYGQ
jgi:3-hydroxyisobutyrate dehydrogenase-like beta-hydroxyacid dehydrogenase